MSNGRKRFTEDEEREIIQLRKENTAIGVIANILRCGQNRVVRFLKEQGMDIYQEKKSPCAGRAQEPKSIEIFVPEFPNARCKSEDNNMFFPGLLPQARSAKIYYLEKIKKAIAICMECQHQEKCLDYALQAEPFGIWGGTTEMEREYIRVQLNITCVRELPLSRNNRKEKIMFSNPDMKRNFELKFSSPIVKKKILQRG